MIPELLLTSALTALLLLGAAELRLLLRPTHPASPMGRQVAQRPAASATPPRAARRLARLRLTPDSFRALLAATGAGVALGLLTSSLGFGLAAGLAAGLAIQRLLPRWRRRQAAERTRTELKTGLDLLAAYLRAGHSLPTALHLWPGGLRRACGPGNWLLIPQAEWLAEQLDRGANPEEALGAMARRLSSEELSMLARVIALGRRRGTDLSHAVAEAARLLADGIAVRSQVRALTAGKRAEGLILLLLPPVMLLLLLLANPTYARPLVETAPGRMMLAIALILQTLSFVMGQWLLQSDAQGG